MRRCLSSTWRRRTAPPGRLRRLRRWDCLRARWVNETWQSRTRRRSRHELHRRGKKKGCAGEATASWRLEIDPWLVARKRTSVQITTVVRLSQNGYGLSGPMIKFTTIGVVVVVIVVVVERVVVVIVVVVVVVFTHLRLCCTHMRDLRNVSVADVVWRLPCSSSRFPMATTYIYRYIYIHIQIHIYV